MPLIPKQQPPYYTPGTGGTSGQKTYTALLTQSGTAAPTAVELENTIGEIVWTRTGAGEYKATLTGAFQINKTWPIIIDNSGDELNALKINRSNDNELIMFTNQNGTPADDILNTTPVMILTYP